MEKSHDLQTQHEKKNYTVIVIVEAKAGQESALKQILLDSKKLAHLENACLMYNLHTDLNNPSQFVLYEQWKSKEDHQEYHKKLDDSGLTKKFKELINKRQAIFAE